MTSVVVVVLDTLRYDAFNKYFAWLDGVRYTNAYSTCHWTGPSHASLLTGRYPSEIGTTIKARKLDWAGTTLPEVLQQEGYTTRNFTTNLQTYVWDGWERGFDMRVGPSNSDVDVDPGGVFGWRAFSNDAKANGMTMYARGLWHCLRSEYPLLPSLKHAYNLKSKQLTSALAIKNRVQTTSFGEKEFLLLNFMDAHAPYYPPEAYRPTDRRLRPMLRDGLTDTIDDPDVITRTYDGCARYLADMYHEIFDGLRSDFDYVITLADHGEHLGEHGLWAHTYGLNPELTHIPVVISGNEIASETVDDVVSVLDIHRTIAELVGIDVDIDSRGQSILGDIKRTDRLIEYHGLSAKRRDAFAEFGIEDRFVSMDRPLDAIVSQEGYAQETHDDGLRVSGSWSEDEARRRLDDLVADIDRKEIVTDDTYVSDAVQERLEDLGYV